MESNCELGQVNNSLGDSREHYRDFVSCLIVSWSQEHIVFLFIWDVVYLIKSSVHAVATFTTPRVSLHRVNINRGYILVVLVQGLDV